jgi:hypothetical protein
LSGELYGEGARIGDVVGRVQSVAPRDGETGVVDAGQKRGA